MFPYVPWIADGADASRLSLRASLDHPGWTAGDVFEGYGLRIGVRTDAPALLDAARAFLPPGFVPAGGDIVDRMYSVSTRWDTSGPDARRSFVVAADATEWARAHEQEDALAAFDAIVRMDVATATAHRLVFVHAGVVEWRGRALLLPGRSGCGKSTLVDALVGAGATYYSDEAAVIDASGRVHPFARPIALRGNQGTRRFDVAGAGFPVGAGSLPIGWIVATRYVAGEEWQPRIDTPAAGLLVMIEHAVGARLAPAHTLRTLAAAVRQAELLEGPRGEATATAEQLLRRLDSELDGRRGLAPASEADGAARKSGIS